jgi:hypothetical protein
VSARAIAFPTRGDATSIAAATHQEDEEHKSQEKQRHQRDNDESRVVVDHGHAVHARPLHKVQVEHVEERDEALKVLRPRHFQSKGHICRYLEEADHDLHLVGEVGLAHRAEPLARLLAPASPQVFRKLVEPAAVLALRGALSQQLHTLAVCGGDRVEERAL